MRENIDISKMEISNKIKVVITHPSQLSERWMKYYCLEDLSKEFDVEFWDCSDVAYPSFKVAHPLVNKYLHVIDSLETFRSSLSKLPKDTVLVSEVHRNAKTYSFHEIQSSYFPQITYVCFYGNDIECVNLEENWKNVSRNTFNWRDIVYRIPYVHDGIRWFLHHTEPDYNEKKMARKCAELYKDYYEIASTKNANYRINHPDLEQYLQIKDKAKLQEGRYIVFIDDFFPYHPEILASMGNVDVDRIANVYHQRMNAFFENIEQRIGCKVVIAAHPYANYKSNNPFNGRDIFYGKTAELIKDCDAVCMHGSNAYAYVALYDKPIALILSEVQRNSEVFRLTNLCGKTFKLPVYSIDKSSEYGNIMFEKMDSVLRKKYIDYYLGDMIHLASNKEYLLKYINEIHTKIMDNIKRK